MDAKNRIDPEVEQLLSNLHHKDRFVQRRAALALGKRREKSAVADLINVLNDAAAWEFAGDAASALGEIGDLSAVPALIAALDKRFVCGRAIEALAKLRDQRAIEPLINFFARNPDPSVATVLGNWGDRRAVDPLINAMDNPDSHVRFYSARALGKLGDRRALPVLEQAVINDTTLIVDTRNLRGKSVAYAAARAIEAIKARQNS
jgi:HEAT repeat protein